MKKEFPLWHFIAERIEADESVMLLVVAESAGSSPGRQGFKMAVSGGGEMIGSIGGGIMEVKLVELAKKMLEENISTPLMKKQIHNKSVSRHQSGMICSGEQTVIYCKLGKDHVADVQKILNMTGKYQSSLLKISNDEETFNFCIVEENSTDLKYEFSTDSEVEFNYRENIGYKNRLFIVGGGHCALALSRLMAQFDFYIHVIEDRKDLNTLEQNVYANEKHIIDSYDRVEQVITSGPDVYIVVMTLGYRTDLVALLALQEKTFTYLGLMGSETKVDTLKEELIKLNFSKTLLQKMHAPIGLKINSHTPEEIAVSIAAEIIMVKNNFYK